MHESSDKRIDGLVDHLFRHQAGQMVSTLTRIFGPRHLDLAEEVVQDALLKALQVWPFRGIPENPTGWLVQVAKNRALDLLRRESSLLSKSEELLRSLSASSDGPSGPALDDELSMIFMACHPSIPREGRIALTLRTVGGFGVREIARAFLARDAAIAQRLVRAKRLIREKQITFELPDPEELPERLDSVLEVIYLLFNEGYTAHTGENLVRRELCEEAIRLCGLLVAHDASALPKSHALLALMLFQAARLPARIGEDGELLTMAEQDRALWDRRSISRGFHHLDRAASGSEMSEYHLQAGIAACHAAAESHEATDWRRILTLYDWLQELNPSPVVALNRVVALSKLHGPEAAIRELEQVSEHAALGHYHLLPATIGELWSELGQPEKAAVFYRQALDRPCSDPERRFLLKKLDALAGHKSQDRGRPRNDIR
ncbi:MAG TPA: sigma-70 family RNA polymerase sigma factor [Blastocatellia bacterium]|nr:sigma-70 family RNA polymerase sigma factor [Blastocatellia bacterium]